MYENLTEEKNILKQAEARLLEENKSLVKQQKGQNVLLTNLQTIQVCFTTINCAIIYVSFAA